MTISPSAQTHSVHIQSVTRLGEANPDKPVLLVQISERVPQYNGKPAGPQSLSKLDILLDGVYECSLSRWHPYIPSLGAFNLQKGGSSSPIVPSRMPWMLMLGIGAAILSDQRWMKYN